MKTMKYFYKRENFFEFIQYFFGYEYLKLDENFKLMF